jgi:hypothetical protein
MTDEIRAWKIWPDRNVCREGTADDITTTPSTYQPPIKVVEASHLEKALEELSAAQKQIQEMQDNCISRSLHESRMWALEKRYQHMLKEQCRINGIGQERELKLMSDLEAAHERIKELEEEVKSFTDLDCPICGKNPCDEDCDAVEGYW